MIKNRPLPPAELRRFSWVVAGGLVFFFTLIPWLHKRRFHVWPFALSLVLLLIGFFAPERLAPIERAWMRIGGALGRFNTRVILFVVFYLVVLPAGILFRVFKKKEAVAFRGFDRTFTTYRIPCEAIKPTDMERVF